MIVTPAGGQSGQTSPEGISQPVPVEVASQPLESTPPVPTALPQQEAPAVPGASLPPASVETPPNLSAIPEAPQAGAPVAGGEPPPVTLPAEDITEKTPVELEAAVATPPVVAEQGNIGETAAADAAAQTPAAGPSPDQAPVIDSGTPNNVLEQAPPAVAPPPPPTGPSVMSEPAIPAAQEPAVSPSVMAEPAIAPPLAEPNAIGSITPEMAKPVEQLTDEQLREQAVDGHLALDELVKRRAQRGSENNIPMAA